jgi:acyl-CoA reductase-like NAD-dependent aldehyde dehydrogenase
VMKMSNDSEYGLMAGVFTQDINKVRNKNTLLLVVQMLMSVTRQ